MSVVEFGPYGMLVIVCEIGMVGRMLLWFAICIDSCIREMQVGRGPMAHVLNLRFGIELYRDCRTHDSFVRILHHDIRSMVSVGFSMRRCWNAVLASIPTSLWAL